MLGPLDDPDGWIGGAHGYVPVEVRRRFDPDGYDGYGLLCGLGFVPSRGIGDDWDGRGVGGLLRGDGYRVVGAVMYDAVFPIMEG